jgi:hypothetical protein
MQEVAVAVLVQMPVLAVMAAAELVPPQGHQGHQVQ